MQPYQRYLTQESKLFDPIKLAEQTNQIVCRDDKRKYTGLYCVGVYGGISTGFAVGCCLRCIFCWVNKSRDFPEKFGKFYSSNQAFDILTKNANKKNTPRLRISGGEPLLCKQHLLNLLDLVDKTNYLFILETNGILLDKSYAKQLAKHKKIRVRVSLKAGNSQGFQTRTGAMGKYYELPFKAIQNLLNEGISMHAAAMTDPRLMPREERTQLIQKLADIDLKLAHNLEEERCDHYPNAIERLRHAGHNIF